MNEYTKTVHKHETGASRLHTACGVSHHIDPDQLQKIPVEQAVGDHDADKCGRCFDDEGGY